jgi:hypothetical protein
MEGPNASSNFMDKASDKIIHEEQVLRDHFQSQLRYGIILWGGTKESIKILRIQKKVIRLITRLNRSESCRQTFKEKRILMVTSLNVFQVVCFIKKYKGNVKQNSTIHLFVYYTFNQSIHGKTTGYRICHYKLH